VFVLFTAAAALAAAVAVSALRQRRRLAAQLARERAAHRLTEGCLHRDMAAFRSRIEAVAADRAVVAEAGRVVDAALAYHAHHSPIDPTTEGGPA